MGCSAAQADNGNSPRLSPLIAFGFVKSVEFVSLNGRAYLVLGQKRGELLTVHECHRRGVRAKGLVPLHHG